MSQYVLFVISGITTINGCFKGIDWYKEMKREKQKDKEYIKELEEEIIRLKREIHIVEFYKDKMEKDR
jgi:hypothetical protein